MSLDDDAHEFGQHFKQGGWRLGFLVARNTEPAKPGRPKAVDNPSPEMDATGKVSFTEFAELANVSQSQVSYHYAAWNLAAADDLCPPADQLLPGSDDGLRDDLEEDDELSRDQWLIYYRKARGGNSSSRSSQPVGKTVAGSTEKSNNAESKAWKAVEALAKTSEQLAEKLVKVVSSAPLQGEDAELSRFVEELRHTRSVLDKHCREIDRVLERIGHADDDEADR